MYRNIIILTGGFWFHETIFESHSIKGYQEWVIDAEIAVLQSVGAAAERFVIIVTRDLGKILIHWYSVESKT